MTSLKTSSTPEPGSCFLKTSSTRQQSRLKTRSGSLTMQSKNCFVNKVRKDSKKVNSKEKTSEDAGHTESDPINVPDTFTLDFLSANSREYSQDKDLNDDSEIEKSGNFNHYIKLF